MAKFCTKCGNELNEDGFCEKCGTKSETSNVQINQTIITKPKSNGFATAGFVISLVSILCCGGTSTIGLVFSIIGLVTANKYDGNGKGLAIAGIIINALLIIVLIIFYSLGLATTIFDSYSNGYRYY